MRLVLASISPRRKQLLSLLGEPFDVFPSNDDERPPQAGEDPAAYSLSLAHQKVANVAPQTREAVVLAGDTVVALDSVILGKPADRQEAIHMLSLLRGRTHRVVTSLVARHGEVERTASETTEVSMRAFTYEEMEWYIDTGEPADKAGGYALQGKGGDLVQNVRGCYTCVVGLPLCRTVDLLQGFALVEGLCSRGWCEGCGGSWRGLGQPPLST